jgi:hypothetical protein
MTKTEAFQLPMLKLGLARGLAFWLVLITFPRRFGAAESANERL